jgi:hypothetical protein
MSRDPWVTLQHLLEDQLWKEALTQVDALLVANPLAAQLHLLGGQLIQLQDENSSCSLEDAEKAFYLKSWIEFDGSWVTTGAIENLPLNWRQGRAPVQTRRLGIAG